MAGTLTIRFKGNRRGDYAWQGPEQPPLKGTAVLVEAESGTDLGFVHRITGSGDQPCDGCDSCGTGTAPAAGEKILKVLRLAEPADLDRHAQLRREEPEVCREVARRAAAGGLAMRLSDAEWQWDRRHLTIYFTAEHRVDFRKLVRELARHFRTRITLRHIGARQEAALLGGIGRCGRELCCSTWLDQPGPVHLGLARDQNLSLNPAQISGGCGRLLCCLAYEHEYYVEARKRFPKEGLTVHTSQGEERVAAVDILREQVVLMNSDRERRAVPLVDFEAEQASSRPESGPA